MPLISYTPIAVGEFKPIASKCENVFAELLKKPINRSDFIRLIEADLNAGKSAVNWNYRTGMYDAGNGSAPRAGQSARGLRTPMRTAVACNLISIAFAKLTMDTPLKMAETEWEQAEIEVNMMMLALIKTCRSLEPKASGADGKKLRMVRNRKTVNINGWSRAA